MKLLLNTLLLFTLSASMTAQHSIQVLKFEDQLKINTAELKDLELIRAESDCPGGVEINHEDKKFSGGCAGVIERTYTLSDACGNTLEKIQYLSLEDNTPPVFVSTPEPEISLSSRVEYTKPIDLLAIDETGEYAEVTVEETYHPEGDSMLIIRRTWTARDACDNISTVKQVVTIPRSTPETKK